jgi:uncharacterized membrane protein YqaE (UPF0057 family)
MKNCKAILFVASASLFLASCSSYKQSNVFLKRKYFNFKKHDKLILTDKATPEMAVPNISLQVVSPTVISVSAANKANTAVVIQQPKSHFSTAKTVRLVATNKISEQAKTIQQSKQPENIQELRTYKPRFFPDHDDHHSDDGVEISTNEALLIILAILISPLAVYLYDKAVTSRFWIDLILWVLGVAILPIFYFSGLFWLAAVIYAILIVTGNIKH